MHLHSNIPQVQVLSADWLHQKEITISVLRLDAIHPVVSGNKIFKLYYFLKDIATDNTIVTFGGAYSNHLAATAYMCNLKGIKCIGIVRGEKPAELSHTLQQCMLYNMQLKFISKNAYALKNDVEFLSDLLPDLNKCIVIPEGGYSTTGALGAAEINHLIAENTYTHISTAVGTGTTLAGILQRPGNEIVIAVPVLKGLEDIENRIIFCNGNINNERLQIFKEYHFGGYAKKTSDLLLFMNNLWEQNQLPTDFVYTAKLFFALFDKIKNNHFKEGSNILALHTGGLQGNLSLPKGSLLF